MAVHGKGRQNCVLAVVGKRFDAELSLELFLQKGGIMTRPELEQWTARFARDAFALGNLVRQCPGGLKAAEQLQKASSSVAANYRASGRARSRKEFLAKIGVVTEEADEAVFWLEYIRDTNLSAGPQLARLYNEAKELRAIFAASYRTARENLGGR